uniref:Restriction modification system DNA specificity domain protein n=1 Tax=Cyanothece sp. (strain PCC 7425 / ATCC 29141) TaxID=395961 RepID=B8HMT9_CYAP4
MNNKPVPEGSKQTEVGLIPENWADLLLGEVITLQRGFDLPNRSRRKGDIPIISSSGVTDTHNSASALGPGVITGRYGTIGEVFFVEGDYWPLNTTLFVSNFKGNDPLFIYFFLKTIDYKTYSGKSGVPGVNRNDLHEIRIKCPPLPEQRSIAQALSDVDALIAALDKTIAKKRAIKTATMQQLLTGKKRLPGFNGVWEVKQLRELAHIQRGASPRPIDNPIWFNNNSSVGWVRISDVTRSGMYLSETEQKLSPLGVQHSRPVDKNSLIMSICATVGRPIITEIDVCIHDGFVVFDSLQAEQRFMYYVLKWIEPDWSKHGQTGSQMNLNTELINSTTVRVPPPPEQTAIATVLSDMDAEIAALEARRVKTQAIKQGMMQELLTGRTRLV